MPAPAPSAAKTHHPDVNASHPDASERFKRITAAYTSALLHSSKRAEAAAGSAYTTGSSNSSSSGSAGARMRANSPRARQGASVDGSRFNVREWETHHYGMHGGVEQRHSFYTDERARAAQQSQYVRNMARQHRARMQRAGRAPQTAGHKAGSALGMLLSIVACSAVWMGVATSSTRFR